MTVRRLLTRDGRWLLEAQLLDLIAHPMASDAEQRSRPAWTASSRFRLLAAMIRTVLQIAKGRIWSGEDAKDLGLVDELGGFPLALRLAKEAAGIGPDEEVNLKTFPRKRTPFEALTSRGSDSSEPEAFVALAVRLAETLRPLAAAARRAGVLADRTGVLSMQEVPQGR